MNRLESNAKADVKRAAAHSMGADEPRVASARRGRRGHQFIGAEESSTGADSTMVDLRDPSPATIKSERRIAGLSQTDAARLIGLGHGSRWAEFESGARPIDGARWELFLLKVGRHPHRQLAPRAAPLVSVS